MGSLRNVQRMLMTRPPSPRPLSGDEKGDGHPINGVELNHPVTQRAQNMGPSKGPFLF